ncbi:MAG TPA: response regulator transcription factor [Fimbriimonadaceae bacterium]|nr:response regulator transcription factor [Fimbriimonadaceae bacterium]
MIRSKSEVAEGSGNNVTSDPTPHKGKKILVVDDEAPILEAVSYSLRKEGFRVSVAMNAEACMRSFREDQPDLIILDVMLPSASGFQVCKKIRMTHDTPIILLTARAEERDKILGLDLGADDYVTKPFSVRELMARVKAILRRGSEEAGSSLVQIGDVTIDEARHEVLVRGEKIDLSPKEFALLSFLARSPGIVFNRQTLLDRVWGADAYVDERTIDVHVRWLRAKIETDAADPKLLVTVRGLGYKLSPDS